MSEITKVQIIKQREGYHVTVKFSDADKASKLFDTFEEANAWIMDQESGPKLDVADGALPSNVSPATHQADEDPAGHPSPSANTGTSHVAPVPAQADVATDTTVASNNLQKDNEQAQANEQSD